MNQMLFVLCLSLLAFGAVNFCSSLAVVLGVRWLRFAGPPRAQALKYILLRAFPGTASVLFVVALYLPVVCRHEPGSVEERASLAMCVLATLAASILIGAAIRALRSIWATQRVVRSWTREARTIDFAELSIPAFVIEAKFPVVAIVGIFHQRLFIARQVLEHCSTEELRAVVAHERAHLQHRDNFLRLLLLCFPDLLSITPIAARLERAWTQASEERADDEAARAGLGLELASALCKVARLARGSLQLPVMALYHGADVAHRANRLLQPTIRSTSAKSCSMATWLGFALLIAAILIAASIELPRLHAVTETAVRFLQ
jgi:beta-lactamase regulating signal transducer with metallopeptidase domain